MKYVNSLLKGFGRFLTYLNRNQMGIQSNIFWLVAFFKIGSDDFWMFAIPAIAFRGIQSIIDELRKEA